MTFCYAKHVKAYCGTKQQIQCSKTWETANISVKELGQVLGTYYKMGLVQMPSLKMYWACETRYSAINDFMSRNRFFWAQSILLIIKSA